jgi:hypothetical protein
MSTIIYSWDPLSQSFEINMVMAAEPPVFRSWSFLVRLFSEQDLLSLFWAVLTSFAMIPGLCLVFGVPYYGSLGLVWGPDAMVPVRPNHHRRPASEPENVSQFPQLAARVLLLIW